jgi:ATP-dependent helicase/DNAse subunit B
MPSGVSGRMPARYLELEADRLIRLVTAWLDYESMRIPFTVDDTEVPATVSIGGLALKLRLDRIDRLNDNSLLVIDYKSGDVTPGSWDPPRPEDVQLPLYAAFALDPDEELGGLVFAKVRPGDLNFAGSVGDAKSTLLPNLSASSSLVRNSLGAEQIIAWRETIEQLAAGFLAGRAQVDPREYPKTCKRCDLQSLCRIQEHQAALEAANEPEDEEAVDE